MAIDRRWNPERMTPKESNRVILDTNFLFIPLKFRIDIFDELQRLLGKCQCVIITPVLIELNQLMDKSKPSLVKDIELISKFMERCELLDVCLNPNETVDDSIIRMAKETGYLVATNDGKLRSRLRKERIPIIYLRQKAFLEMEGSVIS